MKQKCRHNFKGAMAEYWDVYRVVVGMKLQLNKLWECCCLFPMIWQLPVVPELGQDPLPPDAEACSQVAKVCSACGRKKILWTLGASCKVPTYLRADGNSLLFLKVEVFCRLSLQEETSETDFQLNPPQTPTILQLIFLFQRHVSVPILSLTWETVSSCQMLIKL